MLLVQHEVLGVVNVVVIWVLYPDPEGFSCIAVHLVIPAELGPNGQSYSQNCAGDGLYAGIQTDYWYLVDTLLHLAPHPHMVDDVPYNHQIE